MPLRDHLKELRRRVTLIVIGLAIGTIAGWFFFTPAFEALQEPVLAVASERGSTITLNFSGLATALDMRIKVALFLGLLISSPWWLYQVWAFVSPGLKRHERRYTVGFLAAAIPLFGAGVALGWVVFPNAVRLLTEFVPDQSTSLLDAQLYLDFAMRVFLAFGIAFVFPVVMVLLTWGGAVRTRTWLKGWRWAVVVMFTFGAVMTPTPDVITMFALAIPMCALYFGAIGIGALRKRNQGEKAS
ncbi:MAG: twin-arginine translocase subunit TatC [Actinobacteria bacterium HGW-Actinobacteria-4]|nr:MAG: twin-arginine translocase subunit TatC [Actinobacteria bacterium HGW-Actinobacteria-4]